MQINIYSISVFYIYEIKISQTEDDIEQLVEMSEIHEVHVICTYNLAMYNEI